MQRLLQLLYYYRAFLLFVILELFCFYLIIQNHAYQRSIILNSSNSTVAAIVNFSNNVQNYFRLSEINQDLSAEVARLEQELEQIKASKLPISNDSIIVEKDTTTLEYRFTPAKIINNTTDWRDNSITIDKGSNEGIKSGMGVIGGNGIVGQTKYVSKNYSVITSLLHSSIKVSAKVEDKIQLATIEWDGLDYRKVKLRYIPRHYNIEKGDMVYTSGYNSVFPPDMLIGEIESIELGEDATFFDIDVTLSNDFKTLSFVSVIESITKVEKDSVEQLVEDEL